MQKPKLFLFTSTFPYGAEETFLEAEIVYLQRSFDVTIFPRNTPGNIRASFERKSDVSKLLSNYSSQKRYQKRHAFFNVKFYELLYDNIRYIKSIEAIKRIAAFAAEYAQVKNFLSGNEDLFKDSKAVCYSYWLNGIGYGLADFFSDQENVKVIARAHRYDVYDYLYSPVFMPSRLSYLTLINKVFCIADDGKEYIDARYKKYSKTTVSKLGTFRHAQNSQVKETKDAIVKVISVSNLRPVKRVDMIADLLSLYCNERSNINLEWHHYGGGRELEKIQNIVKSAPSNLKIYLNARVPNSAIHKVLAEGDFNCFINLSLSEGIPVSIMEAISYGIPILATDVGGVSEIVKREVGELLDVDFSKEDFVTNLDTVLERLEITLDNRRKIQSFWSANFSADENYQQFVKELGAFY